MKPSSAPLPAKDPVNRDLLEQEQPLWNSIQAFDGWLSKVGYASHDPYDIWGTSYGLFSRRVYYERGFIGLPLIAPILLLEMLAPGLRCLFTEKMRFCTADGQLVLAFLNLYRVTREETYLTRAKELAKELLESSVPGFSGYCWGYPFDWQNTLGLTPKNTPFITATPYAYESFVGLHEATGDTSYLEVAASIAKFVHDDLRDTPTSPTAAAGSYSPFLNDKVVNATAYRAMVLFDAAHRLGKEEYLIKAERNLNFMLENLREDGSWLYAVDTPSQTFIDHFHTCFNLKNLFKLNLWLKRDSVTEAIRRGWGYHRKSLFYPDGNPKFFAIEPRTQIVRLEMYNFAESITVGSLLQDIVPGALDVAADLACKLRDEHQLPRGHFVTRVYRGGFRHKFPFLRWPQAQLFYSLTNLLLAKSKALKSSEKGKPAT